jgi:hypothetical protein
MKWFVQVLRKKDEYFFIYDTKRFNTWDEADCFMYYFNLNGETGKVRGPFIC